MGDSHRHLAIIDDEWDVFMDDLRRSLAKFQVPDAEGWDLVAIVESTRDAVIIVPPLQ